MNVILNANLMPNLNNGPSRKHIKLLRVFATNDGINLSKLVRMNQIYLVRRGQLPCGLSKTVRSDNQCMVGFIMRSRSSNFLDCFISHSALV